MGYIEDKETENEEELVDKKENKKKTGALKTIITGDTIVETPQDVIDSDKDIERKNAFKKAYEILLAIFPETTKRKRKKAQEKEEFDKSIQYQTKMVEKERQEEQEIEKDIEDKDKGMERGE